MLKPSAVVIPAYDELRDLALQLAARAAEVHRRGAGRVHTIDTKSSRTDLVSEVDHDAERVIIEGIERARPGDAILAEETGAHQGTGPVRWIVDPLDGTVNYLYGYPQYCVSIAVEVEGDVVVGVIHDSAKDKVYQAVAGGEATCNGATLRVRPPAVLAEALVATGFAYDVEQRARQAELVARVLPRVRDMRRGGSAALDLCDVARGALDAYYEAGLNPWDVAAGKLIASCAGARVTQHPVRAGRGPMEIVTSCSAIEQSLGELLRALGAIGDV